MQTTTFSAPQQCVLDAIAQGATKAAAAQAASVHRDTIHNWEHTVPGFRDALLAAQASYREELATQLRRVSAKAIRRLEALLDDPATPPAVLFRAIQFVLTRPRFPQKEWALPENINDPAVQEMQHRMAFIEADYNAVRQQDAILKHSVGNVGSSPHQDPGHHPSTHRSDTHTANPSETSETSDAQPARNSLCTCGSGKKYKRCCGTGAPPILGLTKAA
ncbi:MAG: SEC-C domain-containing protein [Bryobacterales bacterium]|nr:SEC-C domain-containing protein [Bryobacterales bacterium]